MTKMDKAVEYKRHNSPNIVRFHRRKAHYPLEKRRALFDCQGASEINYSSKG